MCKKKHQINWTHKEIDLLVGIPYKTLPVPKRKSLAKAYNHRAKILGYPERTEKGIYHMKQKMKQQALEDFNVEETAYLRPFEIADLLGVQDQLIHKWYQKGLIEGKMIGRLLFISLKSFRLFMEACPLRFKPFKKDGLVKLFGKRMTQLIKELPFKPSLKAYYLPVVYKVTGEVFPSITIASQYAFFNRSTIQEHLNKPDGLWVRA